MAVVHRAVLGGAVLAAQRQAAEELGERLELGVTEAADVELLDTAQVRDGGLLELRAAGDSELSVGDAKIGRAGVLLDIPGALEAVEKPCDTRRGQDDG